VAVTALVEPVSDGGEARVAFAVGRRVGPAVVRNRVRRRLRAAARELELSAGAYLVAVDPAAVDVDYHDLRQHLAVAVRKATS